MHGYYRQNKRQFEDLKRDIAHICNRQTLELDDRGGKPCAPFCLKVKVRKEVMR
jgi:hypothetical protein